MNRDAFLALVSLVAASACTHREPRAAPAATHHDGAGATGDEPAVDVSSCDRLRIGPCDEEARPREVCRSALRRLPPAARDRFVACAVPSARSFVLDPTCDVAVGVCSEHEIACEAIEALEARRARCAPPDASVCDAVDTDLPACRARADEACIYSHECASAVHDACLLTVDALEACFQRALSARS